MTAQQKQYTFTILFFQTFSKIIDVINEYKLTLIVLQNQSHKIRAMNESYPQPKAMNFTDINPYELMYRNINVHINEHMTKEHAEIVARQLGYMHNAFGVVVKDFIKILSFKFKDDNPNKTCYQEQIQQSNPFQKTFMDKNHIQKPQAMEIEQDPKLNQKQRVREKEKINIPIVLEDIQLERGFQKYDKLTQKPPNQANVDNIFDQFAFEKQEFDDTRKSTKDSSKFKESLARIVEGVANKKKKESKKVEKNQTKKKESNPENSFIQPLNVEKEGWGYKQEKAPTNIQKSQQKSIPQLNQPEKLTDMFAEYQHQKKLPQCSQIIQNIPPKSPMNQTGIWEFIRPVSKQQPPIYEISDDQQE